VKFKYQTARDVYRDRGKVPTFSQRAERRAGLIVFALTTIRRELMADYAAFLNAFTSRVCP